MKKIDLEAIEQSWDDWKQVPASPFFGSRTLARWSKQQHAPSASRWQWSWRPALLIPLTALNLFWLFAITPTESNRKASAQGVEALQEEYFPTESASDEISIYAL
jgi:hypothetical protein